MPPPTLNAIPVSSSPLYNLPVEHIAVVTKVYPAEYDNWFKHSFMRFRARCPFCGKINKHGFVIDHLKHFHGGHETGTRQCDHCEHEYRYHIK